MKLLLSHDIETELDRLFSEYSEVYILTAWATIGFPLFDKLLEKTANIRKCIVGLHFYQTHPEFISTFLDNKNVRFIKNPEGVFHPKTYLFKDENKGWECIIGSANFTRGAFQSNDEISVLVNSVDAPADFIEALEREIDRHWKVASAFTPEDLNDYRQL